MLSEVEGGGLWIAHRNGCDSRAHNGVQVQRFNLKAKEVPIVFDARRCLHASQSWDSSGPSKRVVLIAWTVIHVRTMSESILHQLRELGFPVPSEADLTSDVPDSWIPGPSPPNKKVKLAQPKLQFQPSDTPGLTILIKMFRSQVELTLVCLIRRTSS